MRQLMEAVLRLCYVVNNSVFEQNMSIKIYKNQLSQHQSQIPQRTLILDIHRRKDEGKLSGSTPEEQYAYYCEKFLGDENYKKALYTEFPEMERLLHLEAENTNFMMKEVTQCLMEDRKEITRIFCNKQTFHRAADITFVGDPHKGGKRAARVQLDNGIIIYYKPHSLQVNLQYQELYTYLCRKAGIACKTVRYISHADYGWEESIENKDCNTKEEVEKYYFRMGIHLFIGYALSATDLHGENIIAHGENPVIIDMETYPGYYIQTEESSASRKTETILAGSVIHTGMLPILTWGQGQDTIIMSAMSNGEKIVTPFKMPVVKKKNTSDVYIDYEQVEFEMKECIVRLQGKKVNAGEYTEKVVKGFQSAYCAALENKKAEVMLEAFFGGKSRVVLRQTQQYLMYRMVSLHPDFMKDRTKRRELLSVLHKEGESRLQRELRDYEIESLLEMDIPYFEIAGNQKGIYDGNGRYYEDYLPHTPFEAWKRHRKEMGCGDMKRQCEFIRLSMAMLNADSLIKKEEYIPSKFDYKSVSFRAEMQIHKIAEWICSRAVTAGTDIEWVGLRFYNNGKWRLAPVGMYLYDGISGIAVFLSEYLKYFEGEAAEKIFAFTVNKMKKYTEQIEKNPQCSQTKRTGLLDGENSIVCSYLMLYRNTGKKEYLRYAKRHFCVVESFLEQDKNYDYLSGNAGAIAAALALYKCTGDRAYLETAIQTERFLWKNRTETEQGVGWKIEGQNRPLAGIAHGNSGFLRAYLKLYEVIKDKYYLEKIERILAYENSLYREECGNWIDLRAPEQEKKVMNTWCHGAPGILLARLKLEGLTEPDQIAEDILKASKALFQGKYNGNLCLCHGLAGNLLIMKEYLSKHREKELQRQYEYSQGILLEMLEHRENTRATEMLNPAFMNGIAGVGFALLQLYY